MPSDAPVELPRAQERLAIAALAMAAFALNLNTNVLGALLPFVRGTLGFAEQDAGHVLAAAALGSAVGALGLGPLAERLGRRSALLLGLSTFVLANLGHLLVASFWPFLVLRAVAGFAVGLAYAAASALAAEVAPYARRGAAMGWFNAGMFLAIPLGMPLSVALARGGWWQGVFAVQAAVAALGALWTVRAVPDRPARGTGGSLRGVLGGRAVVAGLLATMLHVGSFFTTVQLATTWLDRSGRLPKEDQIAVWIGLGIASVVGSAVFGKLADRTGKRRFVLATSLVLVGVFLSLATEPGPAWLAGLGALLAMTAAARTGPLQALVSGLVPERDLGTLMGLRGAVMQVGVFVFALLAQPVAAALQFPGVLGLAAACQLGSFLVIVWGVPANGRTAGG